MYMAIIGGWDEVIAFHDDPDAVLCTLTGLQNRLNRKAGDTHEQFTIRFKSNKGHIVFKPCPALLLDFR